MAPTDEAVLTDKQREVLTLVREGKNPTEIGAALGVTSQAVHGHLRRLRGHGLLPDEPTKPGRAASRARKNGIFDPEDALAAVRSTIETQKAALNQREAQVRSEIEALTQELEQIEFTRKALDKYTPEEGSA